MASFLGCSRKEGPRGGDRSKINVPKALKSTAGWAKGLPAQRLYLPGCVGQEKMPELLSMQSRNPKSTNSSLQNLLRLNRHQTPLFPRFGMPEGGFKFLRNQRGYSIF